jgi:inorganic triphosphatase YgiF
MIETEVKLVAPHGVLKQLAQSPLFTSNGDDKQPSLKARKAERLESRYFDTADRALQRHGLSLRVRKIGRRHCQTLKCRGDRPEARSFAKHEWESTVEGFQPDLGRIPANELGGAAGALFAKLHPGALQPVFATRMRRRKLPLRFGETVVEAAFDEGVIEAGRRRTRISEVELELKSGDGGPLFDLALQLLESAPLALGGASKAQRGYSLAFDDAPPARKAAPSPLTRKVSVDDAVALMLSDCLGQVLANLAAAEDGRGPDGVHQMRVGIRRLRAMLGMLAKEIPAPSFDRFDREAKQLAEALATARSLDALIESLDTARIPPQHRNVLKKRAMTARSEAYHTLRPRLKDPAVARFVLALSGWIARRGWRNEIAGADLGRLTKPAPHLARRLLRKAAAKAEKRGTRFSSLSPRGRHKYRIALKKLRYAGQFCAPLYGKAAKPYLKRVAQLLDALGEDHDAQTVPALLHQIAQQGKPPALNAAIGALTKRQARRQAALLQELKQRRRRWNAAAAFW